MHAIALLTELVTATAYLLGALRLACFCRGRSRYRRGMALLASGLGAALCLCGLDVLLNAHPVSLSHAALAVTLTALIFRSRGNVAALLRPGL